MKSEFKFLRHLLHNLEECGLEDTYLNDIVKCRRILEARIQILREQKRAKEMLEAAEKCNQEVYEQFMICAENAKSVNIMFGDTVIKKFTREDILKWKSQHKDYKKGDSYDFTKSDVGGMNCDLVKLGK